jgi:23S rRNA (adenine2503-C2)-methyltransferase
MTNLPKGFRARLAENYQVGRAHVVTARSSSDGTTKLLLELSDGATVETVGLPYDDRFSCCVSTQVGCSVGCVFCATGMSGFTRNLTAGEIVEQAMSIQEMARNRDPAPGVDVPRIDHVTFMGMGEPLINYEATVKAVGLLNTEMSIGARNMTVSTAGFVPGIRSLAGERLQVTLAVSLHAPNDELRGRLVPGMARWGITEILAECRSYVALTGRRVTLEYCLLDGVNDGNAEAQQLATALHGLNCHVNLIPYNRTDAVGFQTSPAARIAAFREVLEKAGVRVTQRVERGADIEAACGQLRRRMAQVGPA